MTTRRAGLARHQPAVPLVAPSRRESVIQAAVIGVFRAYGIFCYPMNREKGGGWARASHMGFRGIPDIGGMLPGGSGRAFYCEVKRPDETLSPHQRAAVRMLVTLGAFVCVVHSVEEAEQAAKEATRP